MVGVRVAQFFGLLPLCLGLFPAFSELREDVQYQEVDDTISNLLATATVPERWFDQKLDHFNAADQRMWRQRYYEIDKMYQSGGPAFLFVGDEAPLRQLDLVGSWLEYASVYKAMCFALEHRYYGKSTPTPDLSTSNLKYLTVENALEDLAEFITDVGREKNITRWIVFGGSYGAMLATWLRYKFPHLVTGVVAHSAPLNLIPFSSEMVVGVGETLHTVPGCYETVESAFKTIENKLKSDSGTKELQTLFRLSNQASPGSYQPARVSWKTTSVAISQRYWNSRPALCWCDFDRTNRLDVQWAVRSLISPLVFVVQLSDVHCQFLFPSYKLQSVKSMCGVLADSSRGAPLQRLVDFIQLNAGNFSRNGGQCANVTFAQMQSLANNVNYNANSATATGRQWRYQVCTQIGGYASTDTDNQPFGRFLDHQLLESTCQAYFGSDYNITTLIQGNAELHLNYGGLNIHLKNIIFTQGTYDPYRKYGFTHSPNSGAPTVVIQGVGHVAAMFPATSSDKPGLRTAFHTVRRTIGRWLQSSHTVVIG